MAKKWVMLLGLLSVMPGFAWGLELGASTNDSQDWCYGTAMMGYDSVINSRLGVPAEHALDLAKNIGVSDASGGDTYSVDILGSVLGAYIWKGSPHSYAIKLFYDCASRGTKLQNASTDLGHIGDHH